MFAFRTKVNVSKTKLFVSSNTPGSLARTVAKEFGVSLTKDLGMYLGVPLLHQRSSGHTFTYLVDKVRRKWSGWKVRNFSLAARALLIQSVTSAVPRYAMQTMKLPRGTLDQLEKLNRKFLWGEIGEQTRVHPGRLFVNPELKEDSVLVR